MSLNKLDSSLSDKVNNQGRSPQGRLSAQEFIDTVTKINELVDLANTSFETAQNKTLSSVSVEPWSSHIDLNIGQRDGTSRVATIPAADADHAGLMSVNQHNDLVKLKQNAEDMRITLGGDNVYSYPNMMLTGKQTWRSSSTGQYGIKDVATPTEGTVLPAICRVPIVGGAQITLSSVVKNNNDVMTIGGQAIIFLDKDKNMIGCLDPSEVSKATNGCGGTFVVPQNAAFVCATIRWNNTYNFAENFSVTYGDEGRLAPYDPMAIAAIGGRPVNNKCRMLRTNKTWCAIGDSITWYDGQTPNGESEPIIGYQSIVQNHIGFPSVINEGHSGWTAQMYADAITHEHPTTEGASHINLPRADIYTIAFGVNDWGKGVDVGEPNDTSWGFSTYAEALSTIIRKIYSMNAYATIYIMTPRKAEGFGGFLPNNCEAAWNGKYLKEYVEAAKAVAELFSVHVIDVFSRSGANHYTLEYLSIVGSNNDRLHPNNEGHRRIAALVTEAFRETIL